MNRLAEVGSEPRLDGSDMAWRPAARTTATGGHRTRWRGRGIRRASQYPEPSPMRRDQLPPHKTATYVMPRWRAVYVSVNKAACTSMKWLVAGLQGERPEQFHVSMSREVGRAMTIHKRSLWEHTPMLHRLPRARLEAISPEAG